MGTAVCPVGRGAARREEAANHEIGWQRRCAKGTAGKPVPWPGKRPHCGNRARLTALLKTCASRRPALRSRLPHPNRQRPPIPASSIPRRFGLRCGVPAAEARIATENHTGVPATDLSLLSFMAVCPTDPRFHARGAFPAAAGPIDIGCFRSSGCARGAFSAATGPIDIACFHAPDRVRGAFGLLAGWGRHALGSLSGP